MADSRAPLQIVALPVQNIDVVANAKKAGEQKAVRSPILQSAPPPCFSAAKQVSGYSPRATSQRHFSLLSKQSNERSHDNERADNGVA